MATSRQQIPVERPMLSRQTTDNILSYYNSSDAGRDYQAQLEDESLRSRESAASPTSVYSYNSSEHDPIHNSVVPAGTRPRRRPSNPSASGQDKRRLAVVEMDEGAPVRQASVRGPRSPNSASPITAAPLNAVGADNSTSSLLSRRGYDAPLPNIALVAPPDASPLTYTNLSPPMSAPLHRHQGHERDPSPSQLSHHQRSTSDMSAIVSGPSIRRKTSRDVGIVGTGVVPSIGQTRPIAVFQTLTSHTVATSPDPGIVTTPMLTPEIGQMKEAGMPVAGPVVVGISHGWLSTGLTATPSPPVLHSPGASSSTSTSYLGYTPGLDATAGPLPPPPRAMFDIDKSVPAPPRPPRVTSPPPRSPYRPMVPLKENEHSIGGPKGSVSPIVPPLIRDNSDYSIAAQSVVSSDYSSEQEYRSESSASGCAPKPSHIREAASGAPTLDTSSSKTSSHHVVVEPATPAVPVSSAKPMGNLLSSSPPSSPDAKEKPRAEARLSFETPRKPKRLSATLSDSGHSRVSSEYSSISASLSRSASPNSEKTPRSLKRALTSLKRFSALPRTPSRSPSKSVKSLDGYTPPQSTSSSPGALAEPMSLPMKHSVSLPPIPTQPAKTISPWPNALQFSDITNKKTPLERSIGYAQKINELYMYDCGLTQWIITTSTTRDRKPPPPVGDLSLGPLPISRQASVQQRIVSDGSVRSNATFPIRPDAYAATDLGVKVSEVPAAPPPALPYPALANAAPRQLAPPILTSFSSSSTTSSARSMPKSAGGFFSSIGRKTSTRRDRGLLNPSQNVQAKLSKLPPMSPSPPLTTASAGSASTQAPLLTGSSHSVPGGPRAAPGRAQRSQTLMLAPSPSPPATSPSPPIGNKYSRRSAMIRHGSISPAALVSYANPASESWRDDPTVMAQVDKLADLLPHADRNILAGYLRRAGSDLVALGQYIEDEKNGAVRRE